MRYWLAPERLFDDDEDMRDWARAALKSQVEAPTREPEQFGHKGAPGQGRSRRARTGIKA
jgi:TfoX/Sxy family transcriptional regulator of competence genes